VSVLRFVLSLFSLSLSLSSVCSLCCCSPWCLGLCRLCLGCAPIRCLVPLVGVIVRSVACSCPPPCKAQRAGHKLKKAKNYAPKLPSMYQQWWWVFGLPFCRCFGCLGSLACLFLFACLGGLSWFPCRGWLPSRFHLSPPSPVCLVVSVVLLVLVASAVSMSGCLCRCLWLGCLCRCCVLCCLCSLSLSLSLSLRCVLLCVSGVSVCVFACLLVCLFLCLGLCWLWLCVGLSVCFGASVSLCLGSLVSLCLCGQACLLYRFLECRAVPKAPPPEEYFMCMVGFSFGCAFRLLAFDLRFPACACEGWLCVCVCVCVSVMVSVVPHLVVLCSARKRRN
jgi:hypothetical protein